ncbi:uncharacterized protein EI90DRAFT_3133896 [Cantharellus anzutake]|uniref:uncharacterized protein n=1 Tax=Cantharellus anzutake TaxID=1750568 RepID=UPI001904E8AE|nr:uncharacterized protein EI90DRAFT_3133896 [Cantharellus anzutake]KAF8317520.1 hypothetical protein EI90DRAFT_3133896 [Cantharellus anzutake]
MHLEHGLSLGLAEEKPLPKSRREAVYHFIENGHLNYLPDDSDTVSNVLTDGGNNASKMSVKIPENWEEKPLDDPVHTCVQTYLTAKRNGHFPYSLEPHLPTTNPPPVSAPTLSMSETRSRQRKVSMAEGFGLSDLCQEHCAK